MTLLRIHDKEAQSFYELNSRLPLERRNHSRKSLKKKYENFLLALRYEKFQWLRQQWIHLLVLFVFLVAEMAAVTCYFIGIEFLPCGHEPPIAVGSVRLAQWVLLAEGALGVLFTARIVFDLLLTERTLFSMLSLSSIVEVWSAVTMVIAAVTYIRYEGKETIWAPAFLRIRQVQLILQHLIGGFQRVHPAVKEIISLSIMLIVMMTMGVGFYQFSETMSKNCPVSYLNVLYILVVTVSTMGYGDVFPESRLGMLTLILIIFFSMFFLPTALSKLQALSDYLSSQNTYRKQFEHIIVCGVFDVDELRLMLWEFTSGDMSNSQLNIVVVSPEPFDSAVRMLVSTPRYHDCVTLCVSDPLAEGQLFRFDVRRANALFIVSDRREACMRGDLQAIVRSIGFFRHDQHIPQYIALRRAKYASSLCQYSTAILEREKFKSALLALGLYLPCSVPLVVNLFRNKEHRYHEVDALERGWWAQYEHGSSSSVFVTEVPAFLEGRVFMSAAIATYLRTGITIIGVQSSTKGTLLAPRGIKLRRSDKLIIIAHNQVQANEQLRSLNDLVIYPTHLPPSATQCDHADQHSMDGLSNDVRLKVDFTTVSLNDFTPSVKSRHSESQNSFSDHVVIIDLSSCADLAAMNDEETIEASHFEAVSLVDMLRRVGPHHTTVILSQHGVSPELRKMWNPLWAPIVQVEGCGLNEGDLLAINIAGAHAVVITHLKESMSKDDHSAILMKSLVHTILKRANRQDKVSVIAELVRPSSAFILEPIQSEATVPEVQLNYALAPAFVVGSVLSTLFIDSALYQSYFCENLPSIVQELLFRGDRGDIVFSAPAESWFPSKGASSLSHCTYGDIFRLGITKKFLPIGLLRQIRDPERGRALIGHRFFFTNPPPSTPLCDGDHVYYLFVSEG